MRKTLSEAELFDAIGPEAAKGSSCAKSAMDLIVFMSRNHILQGAIVNTEEEFTLELNCRTRDGESFNLRMDME